MANRHTKLDSFSLTVSASNAVVGYDKFAKLSGVSRLSQGKEYSEWSGPDKQLWANKLHKSVGHHLFVSFYYLSSEHVFFVRPQKVNPYFANFKHKSSLYAPTIAGEHLGENVQLRVYLRSVNDLGWCLTVALYWTNGQVGDDEKTDFRILCDFPLVLTQGASEVADQRMEALDFKVDRYQSVDGSTDEFGDFEHFSNSLYYQKNGVTITLD